MEFFCYFFVEFFFERRKTKINKNITQKTCKTTICSFKFQFLHTWSILYDDFIFRS